jgi:hypothetical protein
LDGETVYVFDEICSDEFYAENLEQILLDLLGFLLHLFELASAVLVGQVFLTVEVEFLKYTLFLFQVVLILVSRLIDITDKVVLMIRFPRSGAHITERLATSTTHKVTARRSLNMFIAPRTYFGIDTEPLRISLLLLHQILPAPRILTVTRPMHGLLALKTELGATATLHLLQRNVITLQALIAVCTRTELYRRIHLHKLNTETFEV